MPSPPRDTSIDRYAAIALRAATGRLEKLVELHLERARLPTSRIVGRDQAANTREAEAASAAALEALEVAAPTELRDKYAGLTARIAELESRIDEYRRAQLTAPETGGVRELLGTTRGGYARRIDRARDEIAGLRAEGERTVDGLLASFRGMGLKLERGHVVFMLASASGDDLIGLNAALHNMRQIAEQFGELARASGDAVAARRYYGMSLAMLRVAIYAHDRVARAIGTDYVPRIDALLAANERARAETRALLERTTSLEGREVLRKNLAAQDVTDQTGVLYRQCLEAQQGRLNQARASLAERADVVANTFATATVAAEMVQLMDASAQDLAVLHDMQLPAVVPFDNAEIQKRFAMMTREIRTPRRLPGGGT